MTMRARTEGFLGGHDEADRGRPPDEEGGGATQAAVPPDETRRDGRRPPVATRFKPGRSGNPHGRPKRERHLGALVAAALRERVAVEDRAGDVRRLSKLEATVRQIVDGAASGDARSIKLLFALIKADDRALAALEARRSGKSLSEADALVMAELRRRFAAAAEADVLRRASVGCENP